VTETVEESKQGLWGKLRQRKMVQWGIAYAAGAWGILQGLGYVSSTFDWPRQLQQLTTLGLLVGFPIVLTLAWYHGDRGEQRATRTELAILTLLFCMGGGLFWRYEHTRHDAAGATATTPAGSAVDARSIAVLPFVNMSGDAANEYFSDGISEEILNVLARVPELSVAARTSSFQFKGEKRDVSQIATQLKVRMVLEGSVRKQGDRVRITAQLIDAGTGYHLWSQTYDRNLKDIFAIQDEIARAIGDELKVRVASVAGTVAGGHGTTNLEAHDLYLQGLALWQVRRGDELWSAKTLFERAIAADPRFAQAWAGLALLYSVLADYTVKISYAESAALARDAAERTLVLDPTLPEPYAALGNSENLAGRPETAVALLERAIALRPSFATAHQWLGTTLVPMGQVEKGLAMLERAAVLDPRSVIVASNRAAMLLIAGRHADAIAACMPALEFAPKSILCVSEIALAHMLDGHPDRARPFYETWAGNSGVAGAEAEVRALFDALEGRSDRRAFATRLAAIPDRSWNDPGSGNIFSNVDVVALLVLLKEPEASLRYIAMQPMDNHEQLSWGLLLPVMDPLRCDPRFVHAVAAIGIRDLRAERLCPNPGSAPRPPQGGHS
jgi:adenylate cyclase